MSSCQSNRDTLIKILNKYEEELVCDLSQECPMELFQKILEADILTSDMSSKFKSLDHSRIDAQLQITYLLRLVGVSMKKDSTLCDRFIRS